jgi:hypothetical protein
MKIELSNGYAEIKDVYTRGIAKKANEIMLGNLEMSSGKGESITRGLNSKTIEDANDFILTSMVTKLVIGDKELEIKTEVFDELDNRDYTLIKKAIDSIATPESPKE